MSEETASVKMPESYVWNRVRNGVRLKDSYDFKVDFSRESTPDHKLQYMDSFYTATYEGVMPGEHLLKAFVDNRVSVCLDTGTYVPINTCFLLFLDHTFPAMVIATEKGKYLHDNEYLILDPDVVDLDGMLRAVHLIDSNAYHLGTDTASMYPRITPTFNWMRYDDYFHQTRDRFPVCCISDFNWDPVPFTDEQYKAIHAGMAHYVHGYKDYQDATVSVMLNDGKNTEDFLLFVLNTSRAALMAADMFDHLAETAETDEERTQFAIDAFYKEMQFLKICHETGWLAQYAQDIAQESIAAAVIRGKYAGTDNNNN